MLKIVLALLCVSLLPSLHAQTSATEKTAAAAVPSVFTFDEDAPGKMPAGWGGGPANTISVDDSVAHSGKNSIRLARDNGSERSFSTLTKQIPLNYTGDSLELRGFLRTEDVSDFAGLWMREDQDGAVVAFDNMQGRGLKGTTDWTEYSIKLPLRPGAQILYIGALVSGTGKLWVDDLRLTLDGKPISEAPKIERPQTALDRDHQFDSGSGVALQALTPVQIDNLVMLGKVWGFLKYYHPAVTSGQKHWDYELLRISPAVLAVTDQTAAQAVLAKWVDSLGPIKPCSPCVDFEKDALARHPEESPAPKTEDQAILDRSMKLSADVALRPDLSWIHDQNLLGVQLSQSLISIEKNRIPNQQFYVSLVPEVQNPSFDHELSYTQLKFPDAGYQLLGLYRFWNIIEYWSPNRLIVGEDWDGVLRQFIPRIALAKDATEYQRQMMQLIAEVHDTHANLWSSLQVRPPTGACLLPVNLRLVPDFNGKNQAVVTSFASPDGEATGLKAGDVIDSLDGTTVDALITNWSPYYADSNDAARLRDLARAMTNGECGDVKLGIRRRSETLQITAKRLPAKDMKAISYTHDLPGDTFRLLSPDVAYLKLSSVKSADIDHYLDAASKTKALIIDIRNYPSEFVVFLLGEHLVDKPTAFARFTNGDLSTPGAFHWTPPEMLTPAGLRYAGKVVILVDEVSQSQAEYTAMAFRASPHAVVVGSTTAGADGNVSEFALPGGLRTMISGIGVFFPDKKPTQQIGIVPDKVVYPTIEGIRNGRDEVLEEGIRQIIGAEAPLPDIHPTIAKK
jgi:C-terminal processing protease CtpA/Prc